MGLTGYRTYIGYIKKSELSIIFKEVERLRSLIGTPKPENPTDKYSEYDIFDYLRENASELVEPGKRGYIQGDHFDRFLAEYKDETKDFSDSDREFYFIKEDIRDFFYKLCLTYQSLWVEYNGRACAVLNKILKAKGKYSLSEDDYYILEGLLANYNKEERYLEMSKTYGKNYAPYDDNQFNYLAVSTFLTMKDSDFDYDNLALCIWGC